MIMLNINHALIIENDCNTIRSIWGLGPYVGWWFRVWKDFWCFVHWRFYINKWFKYFHVSWQYFSVFSKLFLKRLHCIIIDTYCLFCKKKKIDVKIFSKIFSAVQICKLYIESHHSRSIKDFIFFNRFIPFSSCITLKIIFHNH